MTLKIRARQGDNIVLSAAEEQTARIEMARIGQEVVDIYVDAPRSITIRHEGDSPAESALKLLSFAVLDFIEKHGQVTTKQVSEELSLTTPSAGDSGFGGSERMLAHHLLSFLHGRELIHRDKVDGQNVWSAIEEDNEFSKRLNRIIDYANSHHKRVSYAVAAEYVGVSQPKLWAMLAKNGGRCPRNSWIVATCGDSPGLPSKYAETQLHPQLLERDRVIVDLAELRQSLGV